MYHEYSCTMYVLSPTVSGRGGRRARFFRYLVFSFLVHINYFQQTSDCSSGKTDLSLLPIATTRANGQLSTSRPPDVALMSDTADQQQLNRGINIGHSRNPPAPHAQERDRDEDLEREGQGQAPSGQLRLYDPSSGQRPPVDQHLVR